MFKKHREDLIRERAQISTILQEAAEELPDIEIEIGKGSELYEKLTAALKEGKTDEHIALLKERDRLDGKNKLNSRYLEELERHGNRLAQIDLEMRKDYDKCPVCSGNRDLVTYEWVTSDNREEQMSHTEKCEFCGGRGEAPVKELLDP